MRKRDETGKEIGTENNTNSPKAIVSVRVPIMCVAFAVFAWSLCFSLAMLARVVATCTNHSAGVVACIVTQHRKSPLGVREPEPEPASQPTRLCIMVLVVMCN